MYLLATYVVVIFIIIFFIIFVVYVCVLGGQHLMGFSPLW